MKHDQYELLNADTINGRDGMILQIDYVFLWNR